MGFFKILPEPMNSAEVFLTERKIDWVVGTFFLFFVLFSLKSFSFVAPVYIPFIAIDLTHKQREAEKL